MWSDGTPVTSADLVFSWRVQTSEELGWAWGDITDSIANVEGVDDHTVRYTFTHRYPYQLMDVNDGPIIPAHAWAGIPLDAWEDTDWSGLVLSAGPFQPVSHAQQQEIVLERNPLFFDPGRPKIERVIHLQTPVRASQEGKT